MITTKNLEIKVLGFLMGTISLDETLDWIKSPTRKKEAEVLLNKSYEEWNDAPYDMEDDDQPVLSDIVDNLVTEISCYRLYTREEVVDIIHSSLDSVTTSNPKFRKIFTNQINDWIEKNL